jgi:uncharacterized integral membrane protein
MPSVGQTWVLASIAAVVEATAYGVLGLGVSLTVFCFVSKKRSFCFKNIYLLFQAL